MKPKQQSEPPAPIGGLTEQTTTDASPDLGTQTITQHQSPNSTGGSDLTALRSENAQLKAAIRLHEAQTSVTAELIAAGARSPELLWDALRHGLEFDDDGNAVNVAGFIAAAKSKYPEQFGTRVPQSIDGGAGHTDTPRLTKAVLAKMKPAEIARLDWNEVKRVLSS